MGTLNPIIGAKMEKGIFHTLFPDILKYESKCFEYFITSTKSSFEPHNLIKHNDVQFR